MKVFRYTDNKMVEQCLVCVMLTEETGAVTCCGNCEVEEE